jgi:MFS family permease
MKRSLLHDIRYRLFWTSRSFAMFGAQTTLLALPLIAVATLNLAPSKMGLLKAAELAPYFVFSFWAGMIADRLPNYKIMITADLMRALFLAIIALLAYFGTLNIVWLCLICFFVGICNLFNDVALPGMVTSVVKESQLLEANSKLASSASVAETAGPAIAGFLISALTAPVAILMNVLAFVASALLLRRLKDLPAQTEPDKDASTQAPKIFDGLKIVIADVILRALAQRLVLWNCSISLIETTFLIQATRNWKMSPLEIGMLFSFMGVGILFGSMIVVRVTALLGIGRTIVFSVLFAAVIGVPMCILPLATPSFSYVMRGLFFLSGMAYIIYQVSHVSMLQTTAPPHRLGQVMAAVKFLSMSVAMLAALAAGIIAEVFGVSNSLIGFSLLALAFALIGTVATPLTKAQVPQQSPD